jgi:cholesterol oxidase
MHVLLPKQASYRAAILAFLDAQLCLVRRELGAGPQFSLASSVRRLLLNFFGANTKFVEELRLALGKHSVMGVLFDAPHSVALAAHAIERYLLGPRPNAHTAIFLAMGADAEWSLTYSPRAKHRLYARTKDKERVHRLYRVEERLMRDFAKAAGGQLRTNPGFSVGQRPITVHAQGGCSMGNDVEDSVVDATGEVWGHPGLFVMDGAMLPSSVGVNPSHTIAAVAELNIAHFLERTRTVSLDQEGRPPPPYVYAIDYGRGPESNSAFEAPRTSSAPVAVPPSVDDVGKPVVEYVPIATSPTSLTWEERMVGFLKQTSGLGKQQHTLHREGRLEPDGYLEHYNAGVFAGYALDLVLKARISDLDVFLSHREPVIDIEGSAQLRIPSTTPHLRSYAVRGTLTLRFDVGELPDAPPRSTRPSGGVVVSITPTMHYDLELEPSLDALVSERENGLAPRHLWGTKLLVDDPGIDAWQDLTTLYTDLADETFGVCLSGIVRVSLQEFLNRQLRSFAVDKEKTTGLSDAQKAIALGRFLKRFFGDLAQLYDVGGTI